MAQLFSSTYFLRHLIEFGNLLSIDTESLFNLLFVTSFVSLAWSVSNRWSNIFLSSNDVDRAEPFIGLSLHFPHFYSGPLLFLMYRKHAGFFSCCFLSILFTPSQNLLESDPQVFLSFGLIGSWAEPFTWTPVFTVPFIGCKLLCAPESVRDNTVVEDSCPTNIPVSTTFSPFILRDRFKLSSTTWTGCA